MRIEITKSFTFEAAHSLEGFVEDSHQCAQLHGHTYTCTVKISGPADAVLSQGWAVDFGLISKAVKKDLDHRYINDVFHERGYPGPTTLETLCAFVWDIVDGEAMADVRMSPLRGEIKIEEITLQEGQGGIARMFR